MNMKEIGLFWKSRVGARGRLLPTALVTIVACVAPVRGQASLPPVGEGSIHAAFGNFGLRDHFLSTGAHVNDGTTRIRSYLVGADYGITDWFALGGSVTYIETKYHGPIPHGDYDDGYRHGTWQDGSLTATFKVVDAPVSVVPFVGFIVPLRDYEARGVAAAGRGLDQVVAGLGIGWDSGAVPFEIDFVYAYRFVERLEGIDTDRQNAALRFSYRFHRRLSGSLFGEYRRSQGGYDLVTDQDEPNFLEVHDAAIALTETRAGVSLTWSVDSQWDLYALYSMTLSGENLQEANQLGVGIAWKFGGNPVLGGGTRHGARR